MTELDYKLTLPQMLREQALRNAAVVAIRQKEHGIWKPLTWSRYFERSTRKYIFIGAFIRNWYSLVF